MGLAYRAEVDIIYIDERLFRSNRGTNVFFFIKLKRGQKMMGMHWVRMVVHSESRGSILSAA